MGQIVVRSKAPARVRAPGGSEVRPRLQPRLRLRLRIGHRLLARKEDAWPPGNRLPGIRWLAAATGVHRNTAAAVYRDLERFGLVRCVPGAGTFPCAPMPPFTTGPATGPAVACEDAGIAAVLSAELGRTVEVDEAGISGGSLLLHPLDETPPDGRGIVPVAVGGTALAALRRLPADSVVGLLSASPRVGQLVRRTIRAYHGDAVGLVRIDDETRPRVRPRPDIWLIDAAFEQRQPGTDRPRGGLISLRLLAHVTPEARAAC